MKKFILIGIAALIALGSPCSLEAKTSKRGKKSVKVEQKQKKQKSASKKKSQRNRRVVSSGTWKIKKIKDGQPLRMQITANTNITDDLHIGMTNSHDTVLVQVACVKAGTLAPYHIDRHGKRVSNIDGNYGKRTRFAVKILQDRYNIKADGYYVGPQTRAVANYILHQERVPNQSFCAEKQIKSGGNVVSTWYHAKEKRSDKYTDKRMSASGITLAPASMIFAGTAAVDPELIRYGSLIILDTGHGIYFYIAGDTGLAVIRKIASKGKAPIVDFYGNKKLTGIMTIVHYEGQTPFQSLPKEVKGEMSRIQNWKGYAFNMPKHLGQYKQLIAKR